MNYYISDLHLFHKNVTKAGRNFDDRPFDDLEAMHSYIKEHWNSKITNGDTVYILGDMAMRGTQEDLIAYVSQLKGHKILIKGNHDDISDLRYQQLYEEIRDYKEITDRIGQNTVKLVLCHYPILMWNNQHRGTILLYGHVHKSAEDIIFRECLAKFNNEDVQNRRQGNTDLIAYNVGCMMPYMNYEPRTLEEIVNQCR
ncbi:MAG: metallophosphoesterase [Lachnospiraceae bacterium]|nr:metallophosphoesterase [Lachnospiraceae bacterium]